MKGLDVLIVRPPGDEHWRGLFEVAQGIEYSLRILDRWQSRLTNGRQIVFNAHRLPANEELPEDAIIFNAEQVRDDWAHSEGGKAYLARLRRHIVWDYSNANIARLITLDVKRLVHCGVGYYPQPQLPAGEEDIDVLFCGSINERRAMLMFDLAAKGLRVEQLFDVYGTERDETLARSKIVLNAHYYENPIFEIFRVSHALANKKCVVTEDGGCDLELEAFAKKACSYVPYDQIANECKRLVELPGMRGTFASHGHKEFRKIDQTENVRAALEQSR